MPLDAADLDAIIAHMNDDHADSVLEYARRLGNVSYARSATLVAIDSSGMTIEARVHDEATSVRIAFDHELRDAADARDTLIALARGA